MTQFLFHSFIYYLFIIIPWLGYLFSPTRTVLFLFPHRVQPYPPRVVVPGRAPRGPRSPRGESRGPTASGTGRGTRTPTRFASCAPRPGHVSPRRPPPSESSQPPVAVRSFHRQVGSNTYWALMSVGGAGLHPSGAGWASCRTTWGKRPGEPVNVAGPRRGRRARSGHRVAGPPPTVAMRTTPFLFLISIIFIF